MVPYVPESGMAADGRLLPQSLTEQGCEVRTFMPRWGIINERRNQLHEVIRLSGMNIIIDDTDHPLIIKVASLPSARMQVYFIDNEDFFHKRGMLKDEAGHEYADNVERAVFYARGVLETVKKLRWIPDVIYCQGWISAVAPFYIRTAYRDEPAFSDAKIVTALYGEQPDSQLANNFAESVAYRDADQQALTEAKIDLTLPDSLTRLAIAYSDGIVDAESALSSELLEYAQKSGCKVLNIPAEGGERAVAYHDFFASF